MSSFKGKFLEEEFCDIVIDNFLEHNYDASAYFLSHCHSDHMDGIEYPAFHNLFQQEGVRFYCSEISKQLLLKKDTIKIPDKKIVVLSKHGNVIHLGERGHAVRVTYLPAGHCPGSIMLLFEGFGKRILYTGDFRLSMADLQKMKPLHLPDNAVLPIDNLYFDSTFADPQWETFPLREESLDILKSIIIPWLDKDPENYVVIEQPAYIGMEYLMLELSDILKPQKIHVSDRMYTNFLSAIEPLDTLTTKKEESRTHFCYRNCGEGCLKYNSTKNTLTIRPSILTFTSELQQSCGLYYYERPNYMKVAYSSHSSFKEIRDFISYLNPRKIYPCVIPKGRSITPEEFATEILSHIDKKVTADEKDEKPHIQEVIKTFVQLSPKKKCRYEQSVPGMESPPR